MCRRESWLSTPTAATSLKDQPSGSFAHSALTRYLNWPLPRIIERPLVRAFNQPRSIAIRSLNASTVYAGFESWQADVFPICSRHEAGENRYKLRSRDAVRRKRLAGSDPGTGPGAGDPDLRPASSLLGFSLRAHSVPALSAARIGRRRKLRP